MDPVTPVQRRVLVVAVLAAFVAFLDGSVVNVALPAIARELADAQLGPLALQQWVVDAYLLTLGALILLAGSLSDVLGRRRVLAVGLVGFLVTTLACALAPTALALVVARALQGVAGALLVPSSLALVIATFARGDGPAGQSRAVGTWTAWTSTAMIAGPLVGGLLVDATSWRWVFVLSAVPAAVTLALLPGVPDGGRAPGRRVDVAGAVLTTVGLAGLVLGLIELGSRGLRDPLVAGSLVVGVLALVAFVLVERRTADPMLPLGMFRVRNVAVGNTTTLLVYAALNLSTFVLGIFLQQVAGYSAAAAGLALLPPTLVMIVFSSRVGVASGRLGPRRFMAAGPLVAAAGMLWLLTVDGSARYPSQVLPGVLLLGVGLALTVAPLTAAILGAVPADQAGIGSAVNNAVARVAGLVATAFVGVIVGAALDVPGLHRVVLVCAVLLALGGLVSAIGIVDPPRTRTAAPEGSATDR